VKEAKRKKILVVGLGDTGKSSIILKFLYGFPDARNYGPEESYFTSIKYQRENFLLNIIDIAGIDQYTPIYSAKYSHKVDGYIFVYSVDNRESFEFIKKLRQRLQELNGRHMPAVLVANKCDLKTERIVSSAEGTELADAFMIPYIETSAKKHATDAIRKIFETSLKEIVLSEDEDQTVTKQYLKGWNLDDIESLNNLVNFACLLSGFIGAFFVIFGLSNIPIFAQADENQSLWIILLVLSGFISTALSMIGFFAFKKEENDYMSIFKTLCLMNFMMNTVCAIMKFMSGPESQFGVYQGSKDALPGSGFLINILMNGVMIISLILFSFLFIVSCMANEIYVRRKKMKDTGTLLTKPLIV